jgi:transcriptional regulator with XRE-family HTH domain
MRRLEKRPWWPELVRQKDDFSLRELAEIFGVSPGGIQNALLRQGLSRKAFPSGPRVKKALPVDVLRTRSPRGRNARQLTEKRLAPYVDQLGQVADGQIAAKIGLSAATVARIRRGMGIPSYMATGVYPDPLLIGGRLGPFAWQVLSFDSERPVVVLADSLSSAVQFASERGVSVREIRRVGALFPV